MKNFLVKNKFLSVLLLFAVLNIFVSYFYIGYKPELKKDAFEYFQAAKFLEGNPVDGQMQLGRVLTTPLFLCASITVNYFFDDFSVSFAVVNLAFYFLCIFAFYFLALEIYKEEKVAFISSILVVCNYYFIDPGLSHLADMGGWFFFIFSTFLAVRYIHTSDRKFYYFSVLSIAIGVFFKEYGGLALANLALLICISNFPWKQKIRDIALASFLILLPIICFHFFIYSHYGYAYFDRYSFVKGGSVSEEPKTLVLLIKILGWVFSVGWLAFLFGLKKEWEAKDIYRLKILLAIFPVTLLFYFWPSITQRLAVMFMMWLSLVAGFGLSKLKWYVLYPFLAGYILFNDNIKILIAKINLPF